MLVPALLDRSLTERPVLRTNGFALLLATARSGALGALGALRGGLPSHLAVWWPGTWGWERALAAVLALSATMALAHSHRTLRRAVVDRARGEAAARTDAITDELTGLYSRRGFRALAEHQLRIARRTGRDVLVLYVDVDVDGFKPIDDRFGHAEGDRALSEVAALLRGTVREADLIGRLGGDEFAVLVADADAATEHAVVTRLRQALAFRNLGVSRAYGLSLSIGARRLDADRTADLEELLRGADSALYAAKRERTVLVA